MYVTRFIFSYFFYNKAYESDDKTKEHKKIHINPRKLFRTLTVGHCIRTKASILKNRFHLPARQLLVLVLADVKWLFVINKLNDGTVNMKLEVGNIVKKENWKPHSTGWSEHWRMTGRCHDKGVVVWGNLIWEMSLMIQYLLHPWLTLNHIGSGRQIF